MAVKHVIVALKARTAAFDKKMKASGRKLSSFGKATGMATKALKMFGVALGAGALISGFKRLISLTMEQVKAEIELDAALRATGENVAVYSDKLKTAAGAIQNLTTYGDEAILSLMTQAKNMGVAAENLEWMAKAAIGLRQATHNQLDLARAMRLLGRAVNGDTTALKRYLPQLEGVTNASDRLRVILDALNAGWKEQQIYAQSLPGQWEQFKNRIGDIGQTIGSELLPVLMGLTDALKVSADRLDEITKKAPKTGKALEVMRGGAVGGIFGVTGIVFGAYGASKLHAERRKRLEELGAAPKTLIDPLKHMREQLDALNGKLRDQIQFFGQSSETIALYKLGLEGATAADIQAVQAKYKLLDAMKRGVESYKRTQGILNSLTRQIKETEGATERELFLFDLSKMNLAERHLKQIVQLYDKLAIAKKKAAGLSEIKSFAEMVKDSIKTPIQQLKDFQRQLYKAMDLGLLSQADVVTAYSQEFKRLIQPEIQPIGEFRTIENARVAIEGLGMFKDATDPAVSLAEKQLTEQEKMNQNLTEIVRNTNTSVIGP